MKFHEKHFTWEDRRRVGIIPGNVWKTLNRIQSICNRPLCAANQQEVRYIFSRFAGPEATFVDAFTIP